MARPFRNSSSANKAFGVFSESQNAGDYIYNKKVKNNIYIYNLFIFVIVNSQFFIRFFVRANGKSIFIRNWN